MQTARSTGINDELFDENVSNLRFVAFDTETTGVSPSVDHMVELAALAFDEEFEQRRFEMLVKPPVPIPTEAVKVHGIDDAMVASEPGSGEVLKCFGEFLRFVGSPRVLLAHNAGFDIGVLNGEVKRSGGAVEIEAGIVLDTCMLAKTLLPELERHGLESLMNHFKIAPVRYHRALEDVRALYSVFMRLLGLAADAVPVSRSLTLRHLVDLAGGYFVFSPLEAEARRRPFRLPPRLALIEPLCGTDVRVGIDYDGDYRYVTPIAIKMRAFRVYVEAFCHRDNIKKTFRADRILRIGKVESC